MSFSRPNLALPFVRTLTAITISGGLFASVGVTAAAPAQAAGAPAAGVPASVAAHALRITASRKGSPYQVGAVGPTRFDCSGLTQWSYSRVGKRLPRTTAQQYQATIRISKAQARPGDLVFFMSGRNIYHTGIYAGNGKVWHSPRPVERVKLVTIWTSAVAYGRVR